MYGGMAVRTALAIGLTNERAAVTPIRPTAASLTWWYVRPVPSDPDCISIVLVDEAVNSFELVLIATV